MSEVLLEKSWKAALQEEFSKPYWKELTKRVRHAYLTQTIYPPPKQLFTAFDLCPLPTVKVIIIGQDPYHGPRQAHGLSFSVQDTSTPPPSLVNIYKEIQADLGIPIPASGNLERWAEQGVLLLNSSLTVEQGKPASHRGLGWEQFTDRVIEIVSTNKEYVAFLLWGSHAQSKRSLIDETKHLVLAAPHPSPLSAHRGFFGCRHFSQVNAFLTKYKRTPIQW